MSRILDNILRIRRVISVALHVLLIVAATYGAFWLRFDGDIPVAYQDIWQRTMVWVLIVRLGLFVPFRLFEGLWKYSSLWDLRNIVLSVLSSTAVLWIADDFVFDWGYPRSVHVFSGVLLVFLLGGVRMARRLYREFIRGADHSKRILIYGAGDAGELIVRDMKLNSAYDAAAIGFIDDDRRKTGQRIHGIPVLGTSNDLAGVISRYQPDELLIAIPSASPRDLRDLVRRLEPFKVRITTLPGLHEIVNGRVQVNQIRELRVEDLLARAPVGLDTSPLRRLVAGRRVIVTGAGGSIGSELCRQIASLNPASLVLFERYENSLYAIHNTIVDSDPGFEVHAVVGDITDEERLEAVFREHRPHIVFHAAAHKHVPLMEDNPCEAIKNNVRGSRIVAEIADRFEVERFIQISTDKAVNPTSVMGASKRVAELAVRDIARGSSTRFIIVRFGNVLGSNGSVVPRFLDQIRRGGPVTVTHPEIRRYFMLIPEAVQLVLHAAAINEPGNVYVLEMGEQIRLLEIARDLIRLSGYIPDEDIPISFVGLRPGEKLFEELVGHDEVAEPSPIDKIMRVRPTADHPSEKLSLAINELECYAKQGNVALVLHQLCLLVPSFTPHVRPADAMADTYE